MGKTYRQQASLCLDMLFVNVRDWVEWLKISDCSKVEAVKSSRRVRNRGTN